MQSIEIVYHIKSKVKCNQGDVALKLDISKAYNRLDWDYHMDVAHNMGFSHKWTTWIMLCVEIVDYSLITDGNVVGLIIP